MAEIVSLSAVQNAKAAVTSRIGVDYSDPAQRSVVEMLKADLELDMSPDEPNFKETLARMYDEYAFRVGLRT